MRIFIVTSDVTSWMLRACQWLLERHWPKHPAVIVAGYTEPALPAGVAFHPIGKFADYPVNRWSDGVLKFLESQRDEVFLWTMDDFWLNADVDDWGVRQLYYYLLANPMLARIDLTDDRAKSGAAQDAGRLHDLDLVLTPPSTPYQLSFQSGLWRRDALIQYMKMGESPAEAEIRGAARMTRANANVLGTRQAPFKYLIAMQHGKLHIDDSGYQAPGTALLAEDRAELDRLGYLEAPKVLA